MSDNPSEPPKNVVNRVISEIADYLGLVFKPPAEQLGLLFEDEVQAWRLANLRRLSAKLRKRDAKGRAHPRIALSAMQEATSTDDDGLLEMWAGLIDSSRAEQPDDANITFVTRLAQMSSVQAAILNYLCEKCPKLHSGHLLTSRITVFQVEDDAFFSGINKHLLDQEVDNLRSLGLIDGGIEVHDPGRISAEPTALGLYMYVRCMGSRLAPIDYFVLEAEPLNPAVEPPPTDGGV